MKNPIAILTESIENGPNTEGRDIDGLIADGVPFSEWATEEQQAWVKRVRERDTLRRVHTRRQSTTRYRMAK